MTDHRVLFVFGLREGHEQKENEKGENEKGIHGYG